MILHPLTWVWLIAVGLGALLLGQTAWQMLSIVVHWQPERTDQAQLKRERHAESAVVMGRWAVYLLTAAGGIQLVGIALIWPTVVAGAMCGTGVLQAMGPSGAQALAWWALGCVVLHAWLGLERLNRELPCGQLTADNSRVLLLAVPLIGMAVWHSAQALLHADTAAPVSCCAAVYDQIIQTPSAPQVQACLNVCRLGAYWLGAGVLLGLAAWQRRSPCSQTALVLPIICLLWIITAIGTLQSIWSAYYYQVLSHPCLWCLFVLDYYGVGFGLVFLLVVAMINSLGILLVRRAGRRWPDMASPAARNIRRRTIYLAMAILLYLALTGGPALIWRLKNGMWLTGN